MTAPWPMRRQLMLAFAAFALVVAVLFGAFALLFTYAVEDRFFTDALRDEASAQLAQRARSGQWMAPRSEGMRLYANPSEFPDDLREAFLEHPAQSEFAGAAGRHYHLLRLSPDAQGVPAAFLVAEVREQLVVRRLRGGMLQWLAWSAVAMLLLALLLGYALARRTTASLATLSDRIEAMQPTDPPTALGQPFASREVGVLARGLEALTGRVHAFVAREREFTRDASHELRTPLAVIHSACERLEHEPSLSDAARHQLAFVRQSVWQLERTVATLLALAREEHAMLPIEMLMLSSEVEQVVLEQGVLLDGKPVDVVVDVPMQARMPAPPAVLRIILANLIGNAFAHTAAGGRVRIDVRDGRLRITNSEGIAPGMREALHEPFAKGAESAGHGLGLAIVHRLCERHAIDVRIESSGQGTCASLAPGAGAQEAVQAKA